MRKPWRHRLPVLIRALGVLWNECPLLLRFLRIWHLGQLSSSREVTQSWLTEYHHLYRADLKKLCIKWDVPFEKLFEEREPPRMKGDL